MANVSFMSDAKNHLVTDPNAEFNVSVTENGALGYATSGNIFVDVFYKLSSLRSAREEEIEDLWRKMFTKDHKIAVTLLFYIGDIRKGTGERKVFRTMMSEFCRMDPIAACNFVELIPEYSRWDIMWDLFYISKDLNIKIRDIVRAQLDMDLEAIEAGKSVSLIGKWLPSYNTSSEDTKRKARIVASECLDLNLDIPIDQKAYRKLLSTLRKAIKVTERYTSANEWDKIDYSSVPSQANLKYKNAFKTKDGERYKAFLESVQKGEAKINSSVAFPYEIVHKYGLDEYPGSFFEYRLRYIKDNDITLEEMWKALPDFEITGKGDILCVVDTSGSMDSYYGGKNSTVTGKEIAYSLGIYFSEHNKGQFKDSFITFSRQPQIIKFGEDDSLLEKLKNLEAHNIAENTDIDKVFDLILNTAIENKYTQSDIPDRVVIISDMEFDTQYGSHRFPDSYNFFYHYEEIDSTTMTHSDTDKRLFDSIKAKYEAAGYKLPKLIFWNVNSRTNTIPMVENDLGVLLVSGCSSNVVKMVLSDAKTPFTAILETLNGERYAPVRKILSEIYN